MWDKLYATGLSDVFLSISLQAAQRFEVKIETAHLDSTSFHVDGEYEDTAENPEPEAVKITYGYSRDHRPDLKQHERCTKLIGKDGLASTV
jgi:transposase